MSKIDELFGERIRENTLNSNNVVKPKTEDELEKRRIDKILTIGLLLLILIVPLVIRVHFSDFVSPQVTGTDMDSGQKSDIFTFYKFITLLIGTSLLTLIFLYKVFFVGYAIQKSKINIFTGLFTITIVLSAVFAPNKTLALFGMYNRHEGTLTYLCYIALFFIASNIQYTTKQLKWFVYILYPFVIINTLLGLLSFFGIDILKSDFGKTILYSGLPEGSNLNEGSKLISTINHGNYVSGIAAVFIALFGSMAIMEKRVRTKVIYLVITTLSFIMLLTSFASSGFVTLIALLPIILIAFFKIQRKKNFAITFASLIILFTAAFIPMAKYEPRVWDETFGFFVESNPFDKQEVSFDLTKQNNSAGVSLLSNNRAFAKEPEFKFPNLPEAGVAAGTGRAYIWEKSIEMIEERPLFGYGLDTFVYHFDQNDPQKHANLVEGYSVIVDKPHNLYVALAFGSGIFALLGLVGIIVTILSKSIKQLWSDKIKSDQSVILIAIVMGLIAYITQSLFNDSIIGTALLFWIPLGLTVRKITSNSN